MDEVLETSRRGGREGEREGNEGRKGGRGKGSEVKVGGGEGE